jgi:hypothetical protein
VPILLQLLVNFLQLSSVCLDYFLVFQFLLSQILDFLAKCVVASLDRALLLFEAIFMEKPPNVGVLLFDGRLELAIFELDDGKLGLEVAVDLLVVADAVIGRAKLGVQLADSQLQLLFLLVI